MPGKRKKYQFNRQPQQIVTKTIHGQLVDVKICRPGYAFGISPHGWNANHSNYHLADLPSQSNPRPRVGRKKIAIDPDDFRSQQWLRNRKLKSLEDRL